MGGMETHGMAIFNMECGSVTTKWNWPSSSFIVLCFVGKKGYYISFDILELSGEVGRSWRYCNARPTHDRAGASSWTLSPDKNQFNIEETTWISYQILSW